MRLKTFANRSLISKRTQELKNSPEVNKMLNDQRYSDNKQEDKPAMPGTWGYNEEILGWSPMRELTA